MTTGSPQFQNASIHVGFYQEWTESFADGSWVAHQAAGVDDCSLVYGPSLAYPAFFYEEQGVITLHLDDASYTAEPLELTDYGYGYYRWITPVDDWGMTYEELQGVSFGISMVHNGRPIEAPGVVRYPANKLTLTAPAFREQLSTEDVRFEWFAAPVDAASTLTLRLHGTDSKKKQPFVADCEIVDDGDWSPPAHMWEWFEDPILVTGQIRRETTCHVPVGDEGEYLTLATLQDVGLSFYPSRPDSTAR